MKKKITIGLMVIALLATGTVYAAMHWSGTENVTNIKNNLELIQIKMDGLESENKETIREIEILLEQEKALREQRERELVDKQKEIENKIAEIQEKNQEINEVKLEIQQVKAENDILEEQLKQALKDVKDIEKITEGMID